MIDFYNEGYRGSELRLPTGAKIRTYSDNYLLKKYDELNRELAEHYTYENNVLVELLRKEIIRRMNAGRSAK